MRLTEEQVVEKFWTEQVAKRERREAIEAMPRQLERFSAVMADAWSPSLESRLFDSKSIFRRNPANELDEWLAEEGRISQVRDALGIRQPWETPARLRSLRSYLSGEKEDD